MKTKIVEYTEDQRMRILLERYNRKILLKQMNNMSHEKAEVIANSSTRLYEISLTDEEIYLNTVKLREDVFKYSQSDSYNFGDNIVVKYGDNENLKNNSDLVIEIFELSTRLVLISKDEKEAEFKVI